ncbi:G-type lectin S-receptor-like serine/threonine-protein kinase At2g19130 [Dendrobium catenatum]|uniref:G-type lectin S-receptor-like serine/threonine-protein kinase At2g19130 n=1 Tax=Dendrobium catenatum TaxID=906689 RepID=UPI0009F3245C|nr:G-type lectin S-receptor-like serine/threonine-protein kinase At2g19130 [Dendrobium catenatum]
MAANISPYKFVSKLLLLTAFFLNTKISMATNSLSLGQSLSGNQTLVSKDGTFALGFFTPGNSHKFYIGVWYNKLPGQTIFWVANRKAPVSDPTTSKLQISDLGNLVLLDSAKSPIWSSNSTAKVNIAILLDTGNLVLRNDSNSEVDLWQSFAHPTDTWMPGGWLGVNKITGEYQSLTSWKSTEDPAPGLFGQSMNPDGSDEYVLIWNGSNIYWSSGLWNGQYFSNVPGTREKTAFNFTFVDNKERKFATYTMVMDYILTRFVVDSEGQGKQWFWINNTQQWQTEFTQPLAHCDVYSLCGPFGVCDEKNPDSICRCAEGFKPASEQEWANTDWSSGCLRKSQLQCEKDGFFPMPNMRLPANIPESLNLTNEVECKEACLKNCSCTAYVYGTGCSIWKGELRNLQQPNVGGENGGTLNLRLADSDLPSPSSSNTNVVAVVVGAVAGGVVILVIVFSLVWLCRRRKIRGQAAMVEGSLVQFSYGDLQRITKNFSEKIGSGGFGSVFKGILPNSIPVAVKKLEDAVQGEKQFRAEVRTLGSIQHVNLVQLHGFCSVGNKRLLVYEYMPRSSLDSQLFSDSPTELNWEIRFQIILGTARGLAYLHEECRECIVHCDVKPDNVLLDADYNPKVSDFGMAKLIGRDFSKVLTTMRGTVGYLAPEWISGLPITPKVDVYSYGMMIFEVVSGKRNNMHSDDGSLAFYPSWASRKIVEGDVKSLLDKRLEDVDVEQLTRVCRVACWCIQDSEGLRPGMGQVVQILEGALEVNMPPLPTALQNMIGSQNSAVHSLRNEEKGESSKEMTIESFVDNEDGETTVSR